MGCCTSLPEKKVICVGLVFLFLFTIIIQDGSGKSTIINHLKPPEQRVQEINVTVGFSLQTFKNELVNFTVFDMSGSGKYRNLWVCVFKRNF